MSATEFTLEVKPRVPKELERLHELADNLLFSWERPIRELFFSLDRELWRACHHSPKVLLRRVDQDKLDAAARDSGYLENYRRVLQWYDNYCKAEPKANGGPNLVAYFCAEFGFHESFPIYSGGLGILAGDHCKAASDMQVPLVAVGLLYYQSRFTQVIDSQGRQISRRVKELFDNLPLTPACGDSGEELRVTVTIADREVLLRVWRALVGRMQLYLLDSDLPENHPGDRVITEQLYGSGQDVRIRQEIVLGIGGVRALRALGLQPEVWHINEGHAAFMIFERVLELIHRQVDFYAALEQVAGATVFTLHTPIPAGHDSFPRETLLHFFSRYLRGVNVGFEDFLNLGDSPHNQHHFNMTSLALRGSRFHNGVSRIHGGVAAEMERHIWPQVPPPENPLTYITNGVHIDSFLDKDWALLFDERFPNWREHLHDDDFWHCLDDIEDETWWRVHCEMKSTLLRAIRHRVIRQHYRNGLSEAMIERSLVQLGDDQSDILVVGFARRFATYKRATLLFSERQRLAQLVGQEQRSVLFLFAGKAHPDDEPGKELVRQLYEYSLEPEFIGRVFLIEGYDMALARRLVAGCDIWLNTPRYPLEACGTSGQKAGINGVLNLSIKDGWWDEGFDGSNGWGVAPHGGDCDRDYCDRQEAMDVLDILENQVVPTYYERSGGACPTQWVELCKASMRTIISRFSAQRMVKEYHEKLYRPAAQQGARLAEGDQANTLAQWKARVKAQWLGVRAERVNTPATEIFYGETVQIRVRIALNGLSAQDFAVECLLGHGEGEGFIADRCVRLQVEGTVEQDQAVFLLDWAPEFCGLKNYRLRVYPYHKLLGHPFEMGFMLWV